MGSNCGQGRADTGRARRVGATAVGLSLEDISDALGAVAIQIDALSGEGAKAVLRSSVMVACAHPHEHTSSSLLLQIHVTAGVRPRS